jgi:hypothetical protein
LTPNKFIAVTLLDQQTDLRQHLINHHRRRFFYVLHTARDTINRSHLLTQYGTLGCAVPQSDFKNATVASYCLGFSSSLSFKG